ncbi:MAG TPA: hypothetical protein VFV87_05880 [Pirellulaceae bacterium]|nr:hypothetical protein [Pirellulaceae bacterium]
MVVKSHRQLRHEREHNELADWLTERIDVLKPYGTHITVAVIVVLLAVIGGIYYFGTESAATAKEWADYRAALNERDPEKSLQNLLDDKPSSVVGLWAAQTLGDINVARGAGLMFSDREQAKDLLEKARGYYEKAAAAPSDPDLVARARMGLGKVYESLCQPEEALKYYKQVADSRPDSAIGKAAASDVKRMENPRTVALLAWFAEQKPTKPSPLPGAGGGLPGLPNDLPDRPDISLPGGTLGLDDIGTGVPASPEPTLPQPGTTQPEPKPEVPTTEEPKPADANTGEARLEEDKPAQAKPAEETANPTKEDKPE